jgi:hypothetical protein
MNTDQKPTRGKHDALTEQIIGIFFDVYNELDTDFLNLFIVRPCGWR